MSTGVDSAANVVVTYHQQLMNVSFIRQGATESMEDYLKRFNALVATTKLVGGENFWYCEKLHDVKMQQTIKSKIVKRKSKLYFSCCVVIKLDLVQELESWGERCMREEMSGQSQL